MAAWRAGLRGFHQSHGGQISMLTVFGAAILASLLGLVVTTGDQVAQKIEMQNAVDAAALSGGIWIARGLNVTSGLNLIQTQLMAGAIVLRGWSSTFQQLDQVLGWWTGVLKSCAPWFPPCAVLLTINEIQHALLKIARPLVDFLARVFAGCPPQQVGLFWLVGKAMEIVNWAVHQLFVGVAMIEAWDLAKHTGAKEILFVPGPMLNGTLKLTMPTKKQPVSSHCEPMEWGSRKRLQRGYHPLVGYPLNHGPFKLGKDRVRPWVWAVAGLPPWGIWIYDWRLKEEKDAICHGDRCGWWPPHPYLLDTSKNGLQYLAIARREGRRSFFKALGSPEPPTIYTYAQVEIYNAVNRAEPDAYTQDWRARLAPASLLDSPLSLIGESRVGFILDDFVRAFVAPGVLGSELLQEVGNH